mmetsp:Transcript_16070/g.29835  ORF Transcript_16070/g.29835 Transcript_16070/m.29835 type:complete len:247 (+) Transcript_16070:99-839(+)
MDLGFGGRNQEIGQATAKALIRGAEAQEQTIEAELAQYDRLLDDEDALEDLRQKRLQQLQKQHAQQKKWKELGHGEYKELGSGSTQGDARDIAKEFFQAAKSSDRMVVHFYRPSTRYCDVFHAHLEKLAPKHLETRFVKINVEGCDHEGGGGASFLVERLGVVVMPTLVLVKDRKAFHHIRGFDEFGGTEDFSVNTLAHVLGCHGVTDLRDDEEMSEEVLRDMGVNTVRVKKGVKKGYYGEDDEFE